MRRLKLTTISRVTAMATPAMMANQVLSIVILILVAYSGSILKCGRMSIITISDLIISFLCLFYIPFQIITSLSNGTNLIHNTSNGPVLQMKCSK